MSLSAGGGCTNVNLRGDGFRESFEQAAEYQRPTEPSAQKFGFSSKAREIEQDFGVK